MKQFGNGDGKDENSENLWIDVRQPIQLDSSVTKWPEQFHACILRGVHRQMQPSGKQDCAEQREVRNASLRGLFGEKCTEQAQRETDNCRYQKGMRERAVPTKIL